MYDVTLDVDHLWNHDRLDDLIQWLEQPRYHSTLKDMMWGMQGVVVLRFTCIDTALICKLTWS